MENTIQNKAKFFAQYWGQEVGQKEGNVMGIDYEINWDNMRTIIDSEYLDLTPLSMISDEDAIEVGRLFFEAMNANGSCQVEDTLNIIETKEMLDGMLVLFQNISDFLRSKGYALPFMGLSVEQIVEFGWVKLKTE